MNLNVKVLVIKTTISDIPTHATWAPNFINHLFFKFPVPRFQVTEQ